MRAAIFSRAARLSRAFRASCGLVLLLSASTPTFVWAQPDLTFTVQTGTRYQTLDNFGTSAGFELNEITDDWRTSSLDTLAEMLFSTHIKPDGSLTGIGLSGFRVEIGACSIDQGDITRISRVTARSKCPLRPNGSYDWTQMDAELYWARRAHQAGLNTVIGYSNSPPIYFTRNGLACRTQTNVVSNLRPDAYGDFADYLARVAAHFDSIGYPLHYISPVNEPQWVWTCSTQEGTQWSTEEIRLLADSTNAAFLRRDVSTKILLTEAGQIDFVYSLTSPNNDNNPSLDQLRLFSPTHPLSVKNLPKVAPILAGHSYWTDNGDSRLLSIRTNLARAVRDTNPDVRWWMTEYSFLGNGYRDLAQNPTSHELGLFMAKVIHADLTVGNAAAWQFWETFESTTGLPRYRLVQVDRESQRAVPEKTYWALGHYSRFIRPGMTRVQVDRSDSLALLQSLRDVMPTAFINPVTGNVTVVAVNYRADARTLRLVIPGMADSTPVAWYLSTASLDMARQNPRRLGDTITVPARSISTFAIGPNATVVSLNPDRAADRPSRSALDAAPDRFRVHKAGGQTVLVYRGEGFTGSQRLLIRDLSGRTVFVSTWNAPFADLPLPLRTGVYLLSLPGAHSARTIVID